MFGFGKTIKDGTRKREIARQVYLNKANLSFSCNSRRLSQIRDAWKQNGVLPKVFGAAFFKKKGQFYVEIQHASA